VKLLINTQSIDRTEKVMLLVSYLVQLNIIVGIFISFWKQNWLILFLTTGILLLTLFPSMLRRNYKLNLPVEFDLVTILFIYSSLFLGEIHAYYVKYWWWDIVLHTSSGFLVGIVGFLAVHLLNQNKKIRLRLKPAFVALFALTFAVTIGSIWEIFEYFVDLSFGLTMQDNLIDTMWDIIVNLAGAGIISGWGYLYLKNGKIFLVDRLIRKVVERNQWLLGKKKKYGFKLKSV